METIEITGKSRPQTGKKSAKELRKQELVPCVLYGQNQENIHFYAHKNEFKKLIYTPDSYIVSLKVDDKTCNTILKKAEFHPVTDEIIHIDFYRIDLKKPFKTYLPVKTNGVSKGVLVGGVLKIAKRKLTVKGIAEYLPSEINLNITELGVGDSIKVNDLNALYPNLEFLDPQSVIVMIDVTRATKSETEAESKAETTTKTA